MQITFRSEGHCLYNTQCFSHDDQWIVFDARNDDSHIARTGNVHMVNTRTHEVVELYRTQHQTVHGPGVGAASFSPVSDRVLFIHGVRNAGERNPYSFTRRTGVAIDIDRPFSPIFMDARNVAFPFTPGALRGGTHAHTWSGDGQWICFTYNDYVIEQLSKVQTGVKDLRTIGVMVPGRVTVPPDESGENNSGELFSVVVAKVTEHPAPNSDEISKAFDEGWIGSNGYLKEDGTRQQRAIAFQGNVRMDDGSDKAEVFVLDLPDDLTIASQDCPLEGTDVLRPGVPRGIIQRRLTHSSRGIKGPRHWLRTTPDGSTIGFLSEDDNGIVQVFGISPNGGDIAQLTFNINSVQGPFNFSPDGRCLAYIAGNSVCITDLEKSKTVNVTPDFPHGEGPVGAVIWSNKGTAIAFNKYVKDSQSGDPFLQIFLMDIAGIV